MDKRYQVFVSSTYEDLREERQEVMQALLELDCIPAGMELFPAANEDQWSLIKKVIDDCDYYIVIIGGRYGSIGPEGISYTQMEYEYAIEINKPVIGFLHKDPSVIPAKKSERSEKNLELLSTFRDLVQQKMCKYWSSPADLGSVVSRSLIKLIKNTPAVGWVRSDLLPSKDTTEEILSLRKRVDDLQNQLNEKNSTYVDDLHELAQGEDIVALKLSIGMYKEDSKYRYRTDYDIIKTISVTWNEIFSLISPILIDEASDQDIKKEIFPLLTSKMKEQLKEEGKFKYANIGTVGLESESYNTIIVQFIALQLISKSTKKKTRSVSDTYSYWTLTIQGENLMMRLRAIRREEKT